MILHLHQDVIDLFDAYTHGAMGRREFVSRLSRFAGGAAAASTLMPFLANDYACPATFAQDDPRLAISIARFDTGDIVDLTSSDRALSRS